MKKISLVSSIAILSLIIEYSFAEARVGDWGEPIMISELPYLHHSSTSTRLSVIDRYSCSPTTAENGPEVVYQLQLSEGGILSASVSGDNGVTDIDIHLLSSATSSNGQATACIARDNTSVERSLSAGTYYLVVDSYAGVAQAGAYTLSVSLSNASGWSERQIASGVTLATRRYDALFGGNQSGSVLRVDLNEPGVEVKPVRSTQCQTTSQLARSIGAVAAINGGYFDGQCGSVSLVKIDGRLYNTNARGRSSVGFSPTGMAMIDWVGAGLDWPAAHHALGGLSRLAENGAVSVEWERDGATSSFTYSSNPRTGVGLGVNGELIMATLDGRTAAGLGASLFDFGQWLVWLGASDALNLDGGGSTTLWTESEGVVNYPSDNGVADHQGERGVSTILAVFAPPLRAELEWIVSASANQIEAGDRVQLELFSRDPSGGLPSLRARHNGQGELRLNDRGDGTGILSYVSSNLDQSVVVVTIEAVIEGQVRGVWTERITVLNGQGMNPVSGGEPMSAGESAFGGEPALAGQNSDGGEPVPAGQGDYGGEPVPAGQGDYGGEPVPAGQGDYGGEPVPAGQGNYGGEPVPAGDVGSPSPRTAGVEPADQGNTYGDNDTPISSQSPPKAGVSCAQSNSPQNVLLCLIALVLGLPLLRERSR